MTLGNQGENDRERDQARTGGKGKNSTDGLTPEQHRERDAKALQEKTVKKAAQAAGASDAGGKSKTKDTCTSTTDCSLPDCIRITKINPDAADAPFCISKDRTGKPCNAINDCAYPNCGCDKPPPQSA